MTEQVVQVPLGEASYDIHIGANTLKQLGEDVKLFCPYGRAIIITNSTVDELYSDVIGSSLEKANLKYDILKISDGEQYKSLSTASTLYDQLVELSVNRWEPIIALGGGVVGDLGGFVAATFMRGIPYIQVPTTLLAQVDSSIGGKVAVNHPKAKNLIGCFYQPKVVLTDVSTLKTLPEPELRAGLAEAIKCGWLYGEHFLSYLEAHLDAALDVDEAVLIQIVVGCCKMKALVVAEDEKDQGIRAILNYGHTIGHAIEAVAGYSGYLHGEAIAIGMMCAAKIANQLGFISEKLVERHRKLIIRAGLPLKVEGIGIESIIERISLDKKARGEANNFVLLKGIGKPVVAEVSLEVVRDVLKDYVK